MTPRPPDEPFRWVATIGDYQYIPEGPRGSASIDLLDNGRWHWEAHPPANMIVLDFDGWWGNTTTKEEAIQEAETYLREHEG